VHFPQITKLRGTAVAALVAVGLLLPTGAAHADPLNGANSTPGYLYCGDESYAITSGSELANAIQLTGEKRVFVVQSIPEWDFFIALGMPEQVILTCVLDEPAIGYPIVVTGALRAGRS
jgi:hypothetical protein